jgi:RNA polymerase sigma-70 factor, ECF subfamily
MGSSPTATNTEYRAGFRVSDENIREFETALSNQLPSLRRRAYRYLGNAVDAEDEVQDALLSAYKHLGQFWGQAQMSTWLMAILINSARGQMRGRPHQIRMSLEELPSGNASCAIVNYLSDRRPGPEHAFRELELVEHVLQMAPQLPPSLRKAFQLRDLEGLSIREMSDRLGLTAGAAKSQTSRARAKLRGLMRASQAGLPNCDGGAERM